MYCYRGVWYNPKDLIKQSKASPKKDAFDVYRGVRQPKAA